ncbi:MAG: hypothetical protein R3E61_08450 [Pseudomonadales bacterium]
MSACPTNDALQFRAFEQTHLPSADASFLYAACELDKNNAVQRARVSLISEPF